MAPLIAPSRLPKVRDRMVELMTSPDSAVRRHVEANPSPGLDAQAADLTAGHLASGELYWVSADMAAVATSAAAELDTVRWTAADRPAASGLIIMDGGTGWVATPGGEMPADAMSWGPAPGGMLLTVWASSRRLEDLRIALGRELKDGIALPPMMPIAGRILPVLPDFTPAGGIHARFRTLATTLAAAWHLMYQPALADRTAAEVDKGIRRSYARAGRPAPDVTVIDLRTLYRPGDPEHGPDTEAGRYSHRWVVRGYWRDTWYPSAGEHRKQWVPSHVKGPDGAPLLVRERVNVWRR